MHHGNFATRTHFGAIGFAFVLPIISDVLFVAVSILWIIPDRRFERVIADRK